MTRQLQRIHDGSEVRKLVKRFAAKTAPTPDALYEEFKREMNRMDLLEWEWSLGCRLFWESQSSLLRPAQPREKDLTGK